MERHCNKCGCTYDAPEWHLKANTYRCGVCYRKDKKEWRAKWIKLGIRVSGKIMPRSYFKKYNKEYSKKPEVRIKRAQEMRARRLDPNNAIKFKARDIVSKAIKKGELVKGRCEICGKKKVDAHHEDYSKPLSINWLCRKHHVAHHKKAKATNNQ